MVENRLSAKRPALQRGVAGNYRCISVRHHGLLKARTWYRFLVCKTFVSVYPLTEVFLLAKKTLRPERALAAGKMIGEMCNE